MYTIQIDPSNNNPPTIVNMREGEVLNYLLNLVLFVPAVIHIHCPKSELKMVVQVDEDLIYSCDRKGFVVDDFTRTAISLTLSAQFLTRREHINANRRRYR